MFETLKKEMAGKLLGDFMHEMGDLGFRKDDIITQIEEYEEDKEDGDNDA